MRRLIRCTHRALVGLELLLALSILRDIGNVTTQRLYLGARTSASADSNAVERFDIEESRVVPQIAIRGVERIAFPAGNPWPSTLHVGLRPVGRAEYEIRWRQTDGSIYLLAHGVAGEPTTISSHLPAGSGVLEFAGASALTWVDPRLIGNLRVTRRSLAFVVCGVLALLLSRYRRRTGDRAGLSRVAVLRCAAGSLGVACAILCLEVGLRALGDHAPALLIAERHDLGEVRKDARWEYTRRFGRRLRPDVDDMGEWRYGDIVRMGFVPAAVTDATVHRFGFHTDAEGFRNARTRERIDIAALGDSFTDAMALDEAAAWPRLLEQRSGLAVQNYGTSGFGPQQQLRVLTDYALAHHPRVVVLAYFAGNDLFDAEAFDEYDRSNGAVRRPDPGWPIRDIVSRADTSFVVSAFHAARRWTAAWGRVEAVTVAAAAAPRAVGASPPAFDRGMFTLPVNGRRLRWAFMPPYLNTLQWSDRELSARKGWALTRNTIASMRDASRARGAELVVMFLPFKSQVYLPVLQGLLSRAQIEDAFRYYLPPEAVDLDRMSRNRLAQNAMMRRFCAEAGLPFLDTTDALAARFASGDNVYFPDDSHLNETGQAVVAEALITFLHSRRPS